jgi:hypothetical protein
MQEERLSNALMHWFPPGGASERGRRTGQKIIEDCVALVPTRRSKWKQKNKK